MLGHRFLWVDRRRDETLSWTSSLLFALVHATGRLAKGQRYIVIHRIDTTKVTTLNGGPVEIHFAPDIMRILDIQGWRRWDDRYQRCNLNQPWYTHEWFTHGVVKSPPAHSWEADVEALVRAHLYRFVPALKTKESDHMRSLYHCCVYTRSTTHHAGSSTRPCTTDELEHAKRLAACFQSGQHNDGAEPSLGIFLDFLGLSARPKNDPIFTSWIMSHYQASHINNADYPCLTRIANNLPELAQTLDLARDATAALGGSAIPATRVWMADSDFDFYCKYLKEGTKDIKIRDRNAAAKKRKEKKGKKGGAHGAGPQQDEQKAQQEESAAVQDSDAEAEDDGVDDDISRETEEEEGHNEEDSDGDGGPTPTPLSTKRKLQELAPEANHEAQELRRTKHCSTTPAESDMLASGVADGNGT